VYEIRQTLGFRKWLQRLPDRTAKARRDHFGPGYRIYFTYRADRLVLLLAGGDKNSQPTDIARARTLIERLETDR